MNKLEIVELCRREVAVVYVRGSGPGGQNINKVATKAQLSFDIRRSQILDDLVKERLAHIAGSRVSRNGILVIQAGRFRTQRQNRADALLRFESLLGKALTKPRVQRVATASAASKEHRLAAKRKKAAIKRLRRELDDD